MTILVHCVRGSRKLRREMWKYGTEVADHTEEVAGEISDMVDDATKPSAEVSEQEHARVRAAWDAATPDKPFLD